MTPPTTIQDWNPVPILMYHSVEDAAREREYKHAYVTRSEFAWQMQSLKKAGYTPIGFPMLHQALTEAIPLPAKPIILTFDDGYLTLLTNAYPLLAEFEWPYTVFLVTDLIGKTNNWAKFDKKEAALLDWNQIEEMVAGSAVDFQPHTATHPWLSRLEIADMRRELRSSREVLEQRLQKPMTVLGYPYGDFNEEIIAESREAGYTMAVTTEFGRVQPKDDLMRLPRVSIYHVPPLSITYGIGTARFWWRVRGQKDAREVPGTTIKE